MINKKICMLGTLSVGKTSLVRRFVTSIFSEQYQTTIGVKVDKKQVSLPTGDVTLMIWDLEGTDDFNGLRTSYLRGAAGFLLVADGTRPGSLDHAVELWARVDAALGSRPCSLVLNKNDLVDDWRVEAARVAELRERGWTVLETSARTGDGVDALFTDLAQRMVPA